jgi:hypothetical protein
VWSVGSKILGALLVPGGLFPAAALPLMSVSTETCVPSGTGAMVCSGGIDVWLLMALIAGWIALIVLPIVVAVHLGRRATSASVVAGTAA